MVCFAAMEHAPLGPQIVDQFDSLTPQAQAAARFVLEHPQDVALLSMREQARRAGVPPVTMLRLARQLGFADYNAFRQVHAQALRPGPVPGGKSAPFSERVPGLQKRARQGGAAPLAEQMERHQAQQVSALTARNGTQALLDTAEAIEAARRVYVLGLRSCFSVAYHFAYVYGLLRDNGQLLDGPGDTGRDPLRHAGPQDVLLAISLAPYTRGAVEQAEFALGRRVTLLAITDSPLSPLARQAATTLLVPTDGPSFFHGVTPAFAACETLLALLAARAGDKALNAIRNAEAQLGAFDTYWAARKTRKP